MMRYPILVFLFFSIVQFNFGIEFSIQNKSIPVEIEEIVMDQAFLGGTNQPRIQWLDWDGDGDMDLFLQDEDKHLRYYENQGNETTPDFNLISTDFQNLLLGNWVILQDFDGDGDPDLVTQNEEIALGLYKGAAYYENQNGVFVMVTEALMTDELEPVYSEYVNTPTFSDMDGDGDLDFFSGNSSNGSVTYYENIGLVDSIPVFSYITNFWQNISIIGGLIRDERHGASAITFIDLDGDGDKDLSWGDYYQQSLYIIWNIGTSNEPIMDVDNIIIEYPENDPLETAGQNMPTFADLDGDNDQDLFVTVLFGAFGFQYLDNFFQYENIGDAANPEYIFITSDYLNTLDFYTDTAPELVDIDSDGDLDVFIGTEIEYTTFPYRGRIKYFNNTGTAADPFWELADPNFLGNEIGLNLTPEFGDIDSDGDLDLFIGEYNGRIIFYRNNGDPVNYSFEYSGYLAGFDESGDFMEIDLTTRSTPELTDIDNDGDLDLFIGGFGGNIILYENLGTPDTYQFQWITNDYQSINVGSKSHPEFVDIDNDSDFDLLVGSGNSGIWVYENLGSAEIAEFVQNTDITIPISGKNIVPVTGNMFSELYLDLFAGIGTGGLYHLSGKLCEPGDVNNDAEVDVLDIVEIVNSILYNDPEYVEIMCSADINEDISIDILDIILIVGMILNN